MTSNGTRNVTLLLSVLLVANLRLPISIAVAQAPAGQNSRPAAAGPDAAVKVTEGQAREIALKAMPGKITDVAIEKSADEPSTLWKFELRKTVQRSIYWSMSSQDRSSEWTDRSSGTIVPAGLRRLAG